MISLASVRTVGKITTPLLAIEWDFSIWFCTFLKLFQTCRTYGFDLFCSMPKFGIVVSLAVLPVARPHHFPVIAKPSFFRKKCNANKKILNKILPENPCGRVCRQTFPTNAAQGCHLAPLHPSNAAEECHLAPLNLSNATQGCSKRSKWRARHHSPRQN